MLIAFPKTRDFSVRQRLAACVLQQAKRCRCRNLSLRRSGSQAAERRLVRFGRHAAAKVELYVTDKMADVGFKYIHSLRLARAVKVVGRDLPIGSSQLREGRRARLEPADQCEATARNGSSLSVRIRGDIERRILSGEWPPGHRILYEHELMAEYGCARMTVNRVLSSLAEAGLIERRRRAGSFGNLAKAAHRS